MQTLFFPVRSPFWYTSFVGVLVNMLMSGGAMWPPIFRDRRSLELNPVSMEQLAYVLSLRGTVIGFHPEGTRNHSPDPFNFLRAKTGLGRLVAGASENATVIPIYINGLSNSFWGELTRNMPIIGRDVGPIRIVFGEPIRVGDLPSDLAPRRLSDMLMGKIEELAKEDPTHPEHLS